MFILPQMFLACVVENGGAFILAISVKNEPLNFHNDARKKRNDQKQKKICPRNYFSKEKNLPFFSIFQDFNSSCPRNLRHFGNGQKNCAHIFEVLITFL